MYQRSAFVTAMLTFGLVFLYAPMLVLVVYSFNDSKLVTVWGGWSVRWYAELIRNEQLLDAAWLSVRLAFFSGLLAAFFGTLAAYALDRFGRFRGRTLLSGLISGPLVMPDVLIGLALLLLFVSMEELIGWPAGRGAVTIVIAHATFGLCYVALVVQARLKGMDRSVEEAAQDLGAPPFRVFITITLPLILPGVLAGFLLAFTLSLDDLVIASFVSGPGSSTLPMVVFSKIRLGLDPQVNALATLLIGVVTIVAIFGGWMTARRQLRG
jgi:putrescine transport system permease protein